MPETAPDELKSEFAAERSKYVAFTENIKGLILTLIRSQEIEAINIESRTKDLEKFSEKIKREDKKGKYKSIEDITDLSGIRVVVYYLEDVKYICKIIEENFKVDAENSVDKNFSIEADRFGYLSIHYVVSHSNVRCELPENKQFANLKAEIQVRTVLQHAWAVLDRRLRYNNEQDIPRELRRRFFRISALLEAADESLSEIGRQITELREKYQTEIQKGNTKTDLNLESLDVYLKKSNTVKQLREARARTGKVSPKTILSLDSILKTSRMAGFTQIDQIEEALQKFMPKSEELITKICDKVQKDFDFRVVISDTNLIRYPIILSLDKEKMKEIEKQIESDSRVDRTAFVKLFEAIWDELHSTA